MSEILLNTIAEKTDKQEKKIVEMEKTLKNVPAHSEEIRQVKKEIVDLKTAVKDISFPIREMGELSKTMVDVRNRLNQPVTNTVQHHHHFPKIIWLTIVLFIALAIVCTGWYNTGTTMEDYKANDTKYRYLNLNSNKSLQELLFITDSIHRVDPGMRDSVLWREQFIREQFDLQQRIQEKEEEVKRLKEKKK